MSKPKVFISHSAHKPEDRQFMDTLVTRLKEKGLNVYCDYERLKVGNTWRDELYSAIGSCHAAVVLLTKEALDVVNHPWVSLECSMLTIISWGNKEFPIYPIRMTDVSIDDIQNSSLNPLRITDKQVVSFENIDEIIKTITNDLCVRICSEESEPYYYHLRRIEAQLASVDKKFLINALECANSDLDKWDPSETQLYYRLSRILLALDVPKLICVLQHIFPSMNKSEAERLINMIAPFWLELPAIARLENIVHSELAKINNKPNQPMTILGLNASEEFTGIMHISRAGYFKKSPYLLITLHNDAGADDVGRFVSIIKTKLKNSLLGNTMPISEKGLEELCNKKACSEPIFVIFPKDTDGEVIEKIHQRFWPLVFIVLTGEDIQTELHLDNFEMLEPKLRDGYEQWAISQYTDVMFEASKNARSNI